MHTPATKKKKINNRGTSEQGRGKSTLSLSLYIHTVLHNKEQ
jgi:hypothetical protein